MRFGEGVIIDKDKEIWVYFGIFRYVGIGEEGMERVPDVVEPADIGLVCLRVYACDDGTNEIWRESTINICTLLEKVPHRFS